MDFDLVAEVERLQRVHDERGLYAFLCECQDCWLEGLHTSPKSPLFAVASPEGKLRMRHDGMPLGCPFSIRSGSAPGENDFFAWTDEWTKAIREDERIPYREAFLRPDRLWALAEWQQTFRDHFRSERDAQLRCRPRRLRAMLKRNVWR